MAEFEHVPDEEALQIDNIVKLTIAQLKNRYPNNEPIRRGVHPKDHGCVTAKFTVNDSLAKEFCVGVFANPGQQFDALIRFSNAAVRITPDSSVPKAGVINHGSRGMAVKLLGVLGTPLLPTKGPLTQDFLMINQPVFAFPNVEEYEALSQIVLKDGDKPDRYFAERIHKKPDGNPDSTDPITLRALRTFGIVRRIASAIVKAPPSVPPAPPTPTAYQPPPISPVDNRYFSGAPFLFGDDRVMKFSAKPKPYPPASGSPSEADIADPNYLRMGLRNRMAAGGDDTQNIVFEFQVQVRDAKSLAGKIDADIEDVCVEWKEDEHPFVTVATIIIPPQNFDSAERQALCEDLIFSPWHGLVEHRPLGGINRLRRAVYEASAHLRHAQPTPTSIRCPHIK
jgi:hypothetical protein